MVPMAHPDGPLVADLIEFPRRPLSGGRECDGLIHVFENVGAHCQCGEEFWSLPTPTVPPGSAVFIAPGAGVTITSVSGFSPDAA
jgi:hypothetical protein